MFLSANLFFKIFVSIPLAHTDIVLGHSSFVGGNIDSVLLYCIVLFQILDLSLPSEIRLPQETRPNFALLTVSV